METLKLKGTYFLFQGKGGFAFQTTSEQKIPVATRPLTHRETTATTSTTTTTTTSTTTTTTTTTQKWVPTPRPSFNYRPWPTHRYQVGFLTHYQNFIYRISVNLLNNINPRIPLRKKAKI